MREWRLGVEASSDIVFIVNTERQAAPVPTSEPIGGATTPYTQALQKLREPFARRPQRR